MEAKVLEAEHKDIWNEFVSTFPTGSILQSWEWGEIKKGAWEPIRLVIYDDTEIVAGISILKRKLPIPGKSMFYAPRGPLVDFASRKAVDALMFAVSLQAQKHGAVALKVDPEVEEGGAAGKILLGRGFIKKKKQIQPRTTFYLDLTTDENGLLMAFEEKTRYNIRLSEKKGVEVEIDNSNEGVETFYKIYQETAGRDGFMIHPLSYYKKIKDVMIDAGLAHLFLAYHEGKPIAGVIVFCFGNKIWYMYGASASEGRNVMPNHAIHWEVIKWAKQKGFKIYDLWGIPSNPTEKHPLWGVYRFKKGFNGRLVKYIGVFDLPFDPLIYHAFDKGVALFQNLRSLVKKGRIEDSLAE